jgi:uncharacterized protein
MKTDDGSGGMSRSVVVFGVLMALGLVLGAFILGNQTRNIGSGRSSVVVKGLAEKPVKADMAEWQVTSRSLGATFPETIAALRQETAALEKFLETQGFDKSLLREGSESVEPHFVDREVGEKVMTVQDGFVGRQTIVISSKSLDRITTAHKAALDYKASGHDIEYSLPSYLVSNLEEIKMSLISAATENASRRAREFIKNSDATLGNMRSASQGAFYILPPTADANTDDYGGTYDKSTIDKIARVVVTVEFNLK